jgi:hypothetical protein
VGVGHGDVMRANAASNAGVAVLFVALTVAMTWPQAARLSTQVYDSDDPLLSIWRIRGSPTFFLNRPPIC